MKRHELEHLIRAAAAVSNEYEIIVIGSQSILGACPDAPDVLLQSMEADVYPLHNADMATVIDGAIGELSPFHERFGYYAQGVGPETAILPQGWQSRLVKIQNENTNLMIGYCLDPSDLAASKMAAGREKDAEFVRGMMVSGLLDEKTLTSRVADLPLTTERIQSLLAKVGRLAEETHATRQRPVGAPRR